MAIRTELSLRLQNSPGALAGVCQLLSEERVNILALGLESSGLLRIVTDNPVHAAGMLRERHHRLDERDVIYTVMPNQPGALAGVARLLAEAGVNIDYAYASVVEGDRMVGIVVGVADAVRAAASAGL
jgi:hypothetical protein